MLTAEQKDRLGATAQAIVDLGEVWDQDDALRAMRRNADEYAEELGVERAEIVAWCNARLERRS